MHSIVTNPTTAGSIWDRWIVGGLLALLTMVICAMAGLWDYKNQPGPVGDTPRLWPVQSRLAGPGSNPALVVFAHPLCPCTRATLIELRELMSAFQGKVNASVVFILPEGVDEQWRSNGVWDMARDIPGVHVVGDERRRESRLFGAGTSGYAVFYDARGTLLFNGGITSARGHAGDNDGIRQVKALMRGETAIGTFPVFGCRLNEPQDCGTGK